MLLAVEKSRVGGRTHRGFGRDDHVARRSGGACCEFLRGGHRVVGDVERQAVSQSLLGVESLTEQQCRPGHLRPDAALQHPGRPASGMNAQLLESWIEKCCGTGNSDIGREREIESGADRRAVDGGNGGQDAVGEGQEPVVDDAQSLLGGLAQCGQVGARAERLTRAGDHDGVHVGVGLGGVDRGAQGRRDLGGHRVAAVGVVDGDGGDAVRDVDENEV